MLKLEQEKIGEVDVITLDGILNADTSPGFESVLAPLCEGEKPKLLMHVPLLTYISSAGIGCFIGVIKGIRNKGGDIRFSEMDRKVRRVFRLLDMDDFFDYFGSRMEGIVSYGQPDLRQDVGRQDQPAVAEGPVPSST